MEHRSKTARYQSGAKSRKLYLAKKLANLQSNPAPMFKKDQNLTASVITETFRTIFYFVVFFY